MNNKDKTFSHFFFTYSQSVFLPFLPAGFPGTALVPGERSGDWPGALALEAAHQFTNL